MAAATWRPAGPDESLGSTLDEVERAFAPNARASRSSPAASGVASPRRFRSADGGGAILLPAARVGVVSDDPHPSVLVVDPPDVEAALALHAQLGAAEGPVVIALPAGAGARSTTGLVPRPGGFSAGPSGSTVEYRLYAVTDRTASDRRLASGPKPGADLDTLGGRARWFDSRHGGPG
jgi:hypothetical protein